MTIDNIEAREAAARLYEEFAKLADQWDAMEDGLERDRLAQLVDKAEAAYGAQPLQALQSDEDGSKAARCAITGVPLLISDELAIVLASALPKKAEAA